MFNPNLLGDSLNYVPANKIKTPIHIVPEWYFLPFYCMLRCIHHKVLGILCMGASIVVIAILAIYPNSVFPAKFDIIHSIFFILFVVTCFNLCFLATQHMTDYIIMYSRIWTWVYFIYFLLLYVNFILELYWIDYSLLKKKSL